MTRLGFLSLRHWLQLDVSSPRPYLGGLGSPAERQVGALLHPLLAVPALGVGRAARPNVHRQAASHMGGPGA